MDGATVDELVSPWDDEDEIALDPIETNSAGYAVELRMPDQSQPERLDKFVATELRELSRSYVQQLIAGGLVRVDGVARRSSFPLLGGMVVEVEVPPRAVEPLVPEAIPLDVVYEDADLVVVNKAAGMVVHPAPGHASGTFVNALLAHAPEMLINGTNRPGIVHRLDKDTSGLIVAAKTDRARNSLVAQWNERTVQKGYVTLVDGQVEPNEGTIDAPIARDRDQRQRMAVIANGKPAVTHFTVRERFARATLLDVEIETGRTHQIRVHMAFIGHPVVGDQVYNRSVGRTRRLPKGRVRRQFLHAARLGFRLPDRQAVSFEAPLPPDLEVVLAELRATDG